MESAGMLPIRDGAPGIEKDKVEARYHNGILTITLPKTAEAKGRRVPVKNA